MAEKITFDDIRSRAGKINYTERPQVEEEEIKRNLELEEKAEILALRLYASEQFLDLQRDWAAQIKIQLWTVLAFQFIFVFLVGFNIFHFTDNISKIPYMYVGIILQNLANIIALGFVVAQFLFPKKNEINRLENNNSI